MNVHMATRLLTVALALSGSLGLGGCNNKLKQENAELWKENTELRDQLTAERQRADSADARREELLARVNDLEAQGASDPAPGGGATGFEGIGGIDVERGARGEVTVRVPGDVLFASGKVDLKSSAKKTLSDIAGVLKREYGSQTVRVEGYTDSDPIKKSGWKDNIELSAQRAMAVERYLASQGVDDERMYSAGFGQANPRASNATPAGKAQNRRVEIVVVMN